MMPLKAPEKWKARDQSSFDRMDLTIFLVVVGMIAVAGLVKLYILDEMERRAFFGEDQEVLEVE